MHFDIVALVVLPRLRGVWLLVGYLSGSAFPQPLSETEEADALRKLNAATASRASFSSSGTFA